MQVVGEVYDGWILGMSRNLLNERKTTETKRPRPPKWNGWNERNEITEASEIHLPLLFKRPFKQVCMSCSLLALQLAWIE